MAHCSKPLGKRRRTGLLLKSSPYINNAEPVSLKNILHALNYDLYHHQSYISTSLSLLIYLNQVHTHPTEDVDYKIKVTKGKLLKMRRIMVDLM